MTIKIGRNVGKGDMREMNRNWLSRSFDGFYFSNRSSTAASVYVTYAVLCATPLFQLWINRSTPLMNVCSDEFQLHRVSKNDAALACYNFDVHHPILNVTGMTDSQIRFFHFTQVMRCFCTTWHITEARTSHLFTQMLQYCISRALKQLLLYFFEVVDLQLIFMLPKTL